jgi:hypothetical protein
MTSAEISNISQSVNDAFSLDVNELYRSIQTPTQMGKPFVSWDMLYGKIERCLDPTKYLVHYVKRGAWTILLVCNRTTKTLYSFMKEKRLKEITSGKGNKARQHYIETLAQLNSAFQSKVCQLSLEYSNIPQDQNRDLSESLSLLIPDNTYIGGHHVVIAIPERMYAIISLRAILLGPDMNEIEALDWGGYNAPSYEPLITEERPPIVSRPALLVKLKKNAHDHKNNTAGVSINEHNGKRMTGQKLEFEQS